MKRMLSMILAVLMVVSVFAVAGVVSAEEADAGFTATVDEATKDEATADEATKDEGGLESLPEKPEGTRRYFFRVPDFWYDSNPYTEKIGIYWWEGTDKATYPGHEAKPADAEGVYYYDVPCDVTSVIWNNFVTADLNNTENIIYMYMSRILPTEFYESWESPLYPYGTASFDGMIYVVDLDKTQVDEYNGKSEFYGEWFYYYGNGEYGVAEYKEDADVVLKGDTVDLSELSPDEDNTKPVRPTEPTEPEEIETYRYYFYMPESWAIDNPYSQDAGIYWWEGSNSCTSWPGYKANPADAEGVYYYDVPRDVTSIIWNNTVDGGMDSDAPVYNFAYQTKTIGSEYYDWGESDLYPDGTYNFDNMIYVIDYNLIDYNEFSGKQNYKGEWFYYYGNGEYGVAENKEDAKAVYTSDTIVLDDVYFDQFSTFPSLPEVLPTETTGVTEATEVTVPTEIITDATEPSETVPSSAVTEPAETTEPTEATEPSETTQATETTEVTASSEVVTTIATESSEVTESTEATEPSSTVPEAEFEVGDANKDGKLNIRDATIIQKHLAKMVALDEKAVALADFDLNGKVNIKDATMIQKKIAGLI